MNFNPEHEIKLKNETEINSEASEASEDSKLINEQEFNYNILSPEENLTNRENLFKLSQNSTLIKEDLPIKNEVESKSKLREKIKSIRESLGI